MKWQILMVALMKTNKEEIKMTISFEQLETYFVLTVVLACLILGYIIKKWVKDVDNKYIPTIVAIFGAVLNLFVSGFSIDSAVFGAFMGLASTGLHQAFYQYLNMNKDKQ